MILHLFNLTNLQAIEEKSKQLSSYHRIITTWQKIGTTEEKNREIRALGKQLGEEESVWVIEKRQRKLKREIFGEFVCLKPPLRLDSNILEDKNERQVEREMPEMKEVTRCDRRREGWREETREERRERRHAGISRDRRRETVRWRGKALKQKWLHAVISIGLKACQDLTLLVQFSLCHCWLCESALESHTNTELKTQIFESLLEWNYKLPKSPLGCQASKAWLKDTVFFHFNTFTI